MENFTKDLLSNDEIDRLLLVADSLKNKIAK
jgi:hypothetical protein